MRRGPNYRTQRYLLIRLLVALSDRRPNTQKASYLQRAVRTMPSHSHLAISLTSFDPSSRFSARYSTRATIAVCHQRKYEYW